MTVPAVLLVGQFGSRMALVLKDAPALSAVILNYRRPTLSVRSALSVLDAAAEAGVKAEVIVLDNSAAETGKTLRNALRDHQVSIVENRENAGFARGSNQGVEMATGRILLLLNSDAFMNASCIRTALAFLEANPRTGIWSPKLVAEDGRRQVSCARVPSLTSIVLEYLIGAQTSWYRDISTWTAPTRVGMTVAACWFMPRSTWNIVGSLDERYYFTGEDADYCKRVADAGLSVVYDPRAAIVHIGSASQPWDWVRDPHLHRSRILYVGKRYGWMGAAIARIAIAIGLTLRKLKHRLERLQPPAGE